MTYEGVYDPDDVDTEADSVGYLCSIWAAFFIALIISALVMTYLSRVVNRLREGRREIFQRWQDELENLDEVIDDKLEDLGIGGDDDENENGDGGDDGNAAAGVTTNIEAMIHEEDQEKESLRKDADKERTENITQIEMQ